MESRKYIKVKVIFIRSDLKGHKEKYIVGNGEAT